jgi:Skp family chaperone for outer membrane proteins
MLTAVSALGVASVTAAGGIATAVIGRHQPRGQRRRDDLGWLTEQHRKEIDRLDKRVDELETDAERDRERAERDRRKITSQDYALRYVTNWVRDLVGYIRNAGLEPPAPSQPMPDEVRTYIHEGV